MPVNRYLLASFLAIAGCTPQTQATQPAAAPVAVVQPKDDVKQLSWSVERDFPHDTAAFTEGLLWKDGFFYESTGLEGKSNVRKVDPASGLVVQKFDLAPQLFGEGLSYLDGKFFYLTWTSKVGFVFDDKLKPTAKFSYGNQGWGLTNDGEKLLQSDGTNVLTWRSPKNFASLGQIKVTRNGVPLPKLNELEWIRGYVWANVWETDEIVVIDPKTGKVVAQLDLTGLLKAEDRRGGEDVLNGIAYDAASDRIYVTGKNWPKLFWLRVEDVPKKP
ncbi:glutaminyl-peptide cyclotransferase [bacterium]|nr:MAG: glutaminyl-peptide cyclotransferase [bacterium]